MNEHLLAEAKQLAVRTNRTLTAVIEDALRETLARAGGEKQRKPVRLTTYGSGGLQPRVDLDNSADLWELLDEADDPR